MNFQEFKEAYLKEVELRNVKRIFHPENKNIIILKYTDRCKYGFKWNKVNMVCRDLVVNEETEEILARGFNKFFSQRQRKNFSTEFLNENYPNHNIEVTEKFDGVQAESYLYNGKIRFASDCSFISVSAKIAEKLWDEKYNHAAPLVPSDITLIVEVIHPDVRVVVPYDFEDLILVGAVNRITQHDYNYEELTQLANTLGMRVPRKFNITFEEACAMVKNADYDFEGFVARYANNERIKIKGDKYIEVFKTLQLYKDNNLNKVWFNDELDTMIKRMPDQYKNLFISVKTDLENKKDTIFQSVRNVFEKAPKVTKKDFAIWVNQNVDDIYKKLMFEMFDDKLKNESLKKAVVSQ